MSNKIIVVGGLAAGPAAASKAKRENPSCDVTLLEKSPYVSYGICELPFFIDGSIDDYRDLIAFTPEKFSSEKGVDVKTSHELKEIDHPNREILVFDSSENKINRMQYDKLILATGTKPLLLEGFPQAKNVFTAKFLEDGLRIKSFIRAHQPKNALIFGAGFIGLELAEALFKIGMNVKIFTLGDLPLENFEPQSGIHALSLLDSHGIEFIKYKQIDSFSIDENRIGSLEIDSRVYNSDIIISAIGIEPNTDLFKGSGISLGSKKGVEVDQKMNTNLNNIYACGDCCELTNKITLKKGLFPFANLAQKTGWVAGENAAGGQARFKGVIPAYALKVFNTEFAHVGLTQSQTESLGIKSGKAVTRGLNKPSIIPGTSVINIALLFNSDTNVIIGADLYGQEGCALRANILSSAIFNKMTLSDLLDLDQVYHPLVTPQRDPIYFCAAKGLK